MIRRKDSDNKKEKEKSNKYNFKGKSTRSIRWFDLDNEWLKEIFRTREPDFYENIYQKNIRGQVMKTYPLFVVLIGNAKITEKIVFQPRSSSAKISPKVV